MNAAPSPAPVGVGLRREHFAHLLERPNTAVDWFEAISENYMDTGGRPISVLESIRRDYPVALHGVSLSIGRMPDPGDPGARALHRDSRLRYLRALRGLADRIDPFLVSDHLCWTGVPGANAHDLLPLPYTDEALAWVIEQVGEAQDLLGRRIVLENVSTYLAWESSTWREEDFLAEVSRRSGCGILLDVNNAYVNARNHGFNAGAWIRAIPADAVAQIHLAGHRDLGTHLYDTHSAPVCDEVWELFALASRRFPQAPVLVEWDEDIPGWERLEQEACRARTVAAAALAGDAR